MKILLLEDNPVGGWCFVEVARLLGHQAEWASNLEAAAAFVQVYLPDVIVADYAIGGRTAADFIRSCKRDEHLRNVPIVVWTASSPERLESEGLSIRVVQKPTDTPSFLAYLQGVVAEGVRSA